MVYAFVRTCRLYLRVSFILISRVWTSYLPLNLLQALVHEYTATAMPETARIVHKDRYNEQHFFDVPHSALSPLEDSWVRVRSRLITINSMNLSYCQLGKMLAWWDEVPLPPSLPSPFNDDSEYGIAPTWGIGEVVESRTPRLPKGTAIYGHMPTTAFPFDMCLQQSTRVPSHWIDVSEPRKKLMAAYNRFIVIPKGLEPDQELEIARTLALQIPFETAYVLNRFVFPSKPGDKQTHPFPESKQPWSVEDADLKNAVVIVLAAGGKSCRAFVQQLATNRAPASGPIGLVEVSSSQSDALNGASAPFKHRSVKYDEASSPELTQWITDCKPKRIMLLDFGGRNNIAESLEQHLRISIPGAKIDSIGIGREAQYKPDAAAPAPKMSGTRMNTSGIRVEGIKQLGEAEYFQQADDAFEKMMHAEQQRVKGTLNDGQVLGVKLDIRNGMRGNEGFEQAWIDLCAGQLTGDRALIFRV